MYLVTLHHCTQVTSKSPEFKIYLSKSTKVLASKCNYSTKSKSTHYAECPISQDIICIKCIKIICIKCIYKLVDLLFSNRQSLNRAEVVNVCFAIIIQIYKVTSN